MSAQDGFGKRSDSVFGQNALAGLWTTVSWPKILSVALDGYDERECRAPDLG